MRVKPLNELVHDGQERVRPRQQCAPVGDEDALRLEGGAAFDLAQAVFP
jgi:hypothetical protein